MAAHPNPEDYADFDPEQIEYWKSFPNFGDGKVWFPGLVGLEVVELRQDFARMRLPFAEQNLQPAGVIHGGVIATAIDTVVVPAIASQTPPDALWSTIDLHVQYMRPLVTDAIVDGWVVRRGRSVVFTRAELFDDQGRTVATGTATYAVKLPG